MGDYIADVYDYEYIFQSIVINDYDQNEKEKDSYVHSMVLKNSTLKLIHFLGFSMIENLENTEKIFFLNIQDFLYLDFYYITQHFFDNVS